MWKLGIPFVWGPVAGASDVPWSYFKMLSWRDRLFYGLKNIINAAHKRFKARARCAARAAKHIFVTTDNDQALISRRWGFESQIMLDTGRPNWKGVCGNMTAAGRYGSFGADFMWGARLCRCS